MHLFYVEFLFSVIFTKIIWVLHCIFMGKNSQCWLGGKNSYFFWGLLTPPPFSITMLQSVHGYQMFLCSERLVVAIVTVLVLTYYQLLVVSFAKSFFGK